MKCFSPSPRAIVSILVEVDRSWFVSMSLTLQCLWFELTHDAMTRKIRAGSDLRHDVRYIHRYKEINIWKIYSKLVYVGLAQARPNYVMA